MKIELDFWAVCGFIAISFLVQFSGDVGAETQEESTHRVATAVRIKDTPPQLDGVLDDNIWKSAPLHEGFRQRDPDEGEPASHCLWDKTDSEEGQPTQALLDVVESESFKGERGVVIVAWRMKDLLIKRNYKVIGEQEGYFLALKAFAPNQHAAFITDRRTPQVELIEGKVTIDVFWNVWCSYCAHGLAQLEWVRQACKTAVQEVGERLILREHLIDRANTLNYGIGEQHIVLINGEKWSGHGYDKDDDPKPFIQKIKELTSEVDQDSLR